MVGKQVWLSDYWWMFVSKVVESGIRHSRSQVVSEALQRYREPLEREMQDWDEFKEEKKK